MSATSEHQKTRQNRRNRTVTVQYPQDASGLTQSQKRPRRLPKDHQDYWVGRLVKRSYSDSTGRTVEIPDWHVRFFAGPNQAWFNLGTSNKAAAAAKARDIYVHLKANGWDATVAKFKPRTEQTPADRLTIGEYLQAAQKTGVLKDRTFLNYQNCLRTIVAGAFGIKGGKERFDYRTGGNQKWVARIEAIRMSRLTPVRIDRWKFHFVEQAGKSPVAIGSARRTVNSYIRCARSLFSRELMQKPPVKGLQLPTPLPFDGVDLFRKRDGTVDTGSVRYVSRISAQALIAAAKEELKQGDAEAYKAFLLGLLAGLRKGEIDLLEWRMLDFANNVIRLEETEWLHLKTEDSAGDVTVDPEVLAELRGLMGKSKSKFVLSSDRRPRNDSARPYYRCEPTFDRLTAWLRSKGITANKPLHELRKEIGAMIATEHGIYAASRFLRHSDITTTARHYADQKARITVGLGKLLNTEIRPVDAQADTAG